jgi:hypothetical protein
VLTIICKTVCKEAKSFVGAFAELRKVTISFVMSVCLSVRMEQLGSHRTNFRSIWYLNIFRKSIEKIQVWLNSDKKKGYFTWRPMYIYDNISLISYYNEKYFGKVVDAVKPHFISSTFLFRMSCRLWDNVEEYGRARQATDDNIMLRRKCATCMPDNEGTNTDTHS